MEIGGDNELTRHARDLLRGIEETVRKSYGVGLNEYLRCADIFNEAVEYMQRGNWKKAIAGFKDCLKIVNTHYQSYGNMGLCYMKLGQREEALSAFNKAIEIKPDYEIAIVNRALLGSGVEIHDILIEIVSYTTDYEMKKKSYIAETVESIFSQFSEGSTNNVQDSP